MGWEVAVVHQQSRKASLGRTLRMIYLMVRGGTSCAQWERCIGDQKSARMNHQRQSWATRTIRKTLEEELVRALGRSEGSCPGLPGALQRCQPLGKAPLASSLQMANTRWRVSITDLGLGPLGGYLVQLVTETKRHSISGVGQAAATSRSTSVPYDCSGRQRTPK